MALVRDEDGEYYEHDQVEMFDTILRDGEQAGHKMSPDTKLAIAHRLKDLGVDVIEAGFPISSQGDGYSVAQIAKQVRGVKICALARILDPDIDAAARAIEHADKPRLHVFIATSDIHVQEKLRMNKETVLDLITNGVMRAKKYCSDVEFSPEDAGRTSPHFLAQSVLTAIEAGATVINIPDTVGYQTPWTFEELIAGVYKAVPQLRNVLVSVHCHNDLGLAVVNSLAGIRAGARQVEGCFLGIGERAGNVDLEQVIMALNVRSDFFRCRTNIVTEKIGPTCRFIAQEIGYQFEDHKPIIGRRAFSHSSGIHDDGVQKDRRTYEIMTPASVGWVGTTRELVSHLGRSGLCDELNLLGYDGETIVDAIYPRFTQLADIKVKLSTEDLLMLVQEYHIQNAIARDQLFKLVEVEYAPGVGLVKLMRGGESVRKSGCGDGAIAGIYNALMDAFAAHGVNVGGIELDDYSVIKGQGGPEAIAWTVVRLKRGQQEGYARSGDPDTVKAFAYACVYAMNHFLNAPAGSVVQETAQTSV
jgi:2-isopropylmalate synthase